MSFLSANTSERRLSLNGRNAYVTLSVDENLVNKTNKKIDDSLYLTAKPVNRARSSSPALLTVNDNTTKESKSADVKKSSNNENILVAPEGMLYKSPSDNKSPAVSSNSINPMSGASPNIGQPLHSEQKPQVQVGMDRYITVLKRGRSPKSSKISSLPKFSKDSDTDREKYDNRFSLLENETSEEINKVSSAKPPPIYLRELNSNSLVQGLISLIGKNSFYVIPIKRGSIHETKIQVNSETD